MNTKLIEARKAAEHTQVTFAQALGVSQSVVSEWERGAYPRDAMKVRIAALLGADAYELFPLQAAAAS